MSVVLGSPRCSSVQSALSVSAKDSHTSCAAVSFLLRGDLTQEVESDGVRTQRDGCLSPSPTPFLVAYRVTNDHINRW